MKVIHHVSIKPLPYMEAAVTGWFAVMDARLHIANVKSESTSVFRYPARLKSSVTSFFTLPKHSCYQLLHVAETLVLLVLVHAQLGQKPPQRLFMHHAVAHEDESEYGDQKAAPLQHRLVLLNPLADRQAGSPSAFIVYVFIYLFIYTYNDILITC